MKQRMAAITDRKSIEKKDNRSKTLGGKTQLCIYHLVSNLASPNRLYRSEGGEDPPIRIFKQDLSHEAIILGLHLVSKISPEPSDVVGVFWDIGLFFAGIILSLRRLKLLSKQNTLHWWLSVFRSSSLGICLPKS